eukprot:scaffold864_cov114-Skeletonema_marinoi.AAC.1
MPSKKKARGKIKARRVAKSRKAREEDAAANVTAQMQRLRSVAINLAAAEKDELEAAAKNDEANNTEECLHGFVTLPSGRIESEGPLLDGFDNAIMKQRIESTPKYGMIQTSEMVYFLFFDQCNGTDKILKGNSTLYYDAMFVSFLEQWIAIHIEKAQASCHLIKIAELFKSDKHTLVSFFRKRIPCKCLDNNTKKSSPSQRWVCVAMKTAAMGRSNAARCWACLALDAE